jgi:DNA-directed RNA polymerase
MWLQGGARGEMQQVKRRVHNQRMIFGVAVDAIYKKRCSGAADLCCLSVRLLSALVAPHPWGETVSCLCY